MNEQTFGSQYAQHAHINKDFACLVVLYIDKEKGKLKLTE